MGVLSLLVAGPTLAAIAASDCERLAGGTLAQPVNALTSLAFVVVAAVVGATAGRGRRDRLPSLVLAGLLAAVGIGSVAFHGPQPVGARALHDVPIAVTALFVLVVNLASLHAPRAAGRARIRTLMSVVAAAGLVVLLVLAPGAGPAATALLVVGAVLTQVGALRSGRGSPAEARRGTIAFGFLLLAAATLFLAGRSASPVCHPDTVLQPHGLWHVVAALGLGLWWWEALGPGSRPAVQIVSSERSPDAQPLRSAGPR